MPTCTSVCTKTPICCQAEGSLSVLEIRCISATSPTQVPTTSQCRSVWTSVDFGYPQLLAQNTCQASHCAPVPFQ